MRGFTDQPTKFILYQKPSCTPFFANQLHRSFVLVCFAKSVTKNGKLVGGVSFKSDRSGLVMSRDTGGGCWLVVPLYSTWFKFPCGYSVVTLSRLLWLGFDGWGSRSSASRSVRRSLVFSSSSSTSSSSSSFSSRRASRQSRRARPSGLMLNTWMRRCEAIWRHTPEQYRARSSREST